MKPLHLTPTGEGTDLTPVELRTARGLVAETIRHEMDEHHLAHWPWHRPSARRRAAERLLARRSRLMVVTDTDGPHRQVIAAATYRATSARLGRAASVPLAVVRRCTRGVVIFGSMLVLLALRHGHTGLGALATFGLVVGVGSSPFLSSLRVQLSDRVVAGRARLFATVRDAASEMIVLRHLGFPQLARSAGLEWSADRVVAALRAKDDERLRVTVPCCVEMASLYASCRGVTWAPLHADVERSVLVFDPSKQHTAEFPRVASAPV